MVKKKGWIIGILVVSLFLLELVARGILRLPRDINFSKMAFIPVPSNLDISYLIFIAQWAILFLIIFLAFLKFRRRRTKEKKTINSRKMIPKKSRSETDLDILYNLLKEKKSLSTKSISELFKVSKEKALEWAKILENYNLVTIEYPTFNVPMVKINEKENKEETTLAKKDADKEKGKHSKEKEDSKKSSKKTKEATKPKKKKVKQRKK